MTCAPIGQRQESGDYRESWQPATEPDGEAERRATSHVPPLKAWWPRLRRPAKPVGAYSAWNCSCSPTARFCSTRSPRPHDTGMVTMASQRLSVALHAPRDSRLPITPEHVKSFTIGGGGRRLWWPATVRSSSPMWPLLAEPGPRIFAQSEVHGHIAPWHWPSASPEARRHVPKAGLVPMRDDYRGQKRHDQLSMASILLPSGRG